MGEYRISRPGVYDMPAEYYHADPVQGGSLSSTGARALLPPGTPAKFIHNLRHPQPAKKHFEAGHAAHRMVLGAGPELRVIPATDRRKKTTKQAIKTARDEHAVPLIEPEMEIIEAMAEAIRAHPIAGKMFTPGTGKAEQSFIWRDERTGVWCRARPDWLPHRKGGRLVLADYKTTMDASDDAIQRSIHKFGYHQQAVWYSDGAIALGLASEVAFVFVWQEKTAPYLVRVTQLDAEAIDIGAAKNARALDIYAECRETGHWPGYEPDIEFISLPVWAENNDTREYLQ